MSAALAYTDASASARALHVLDRTQLAAWRTAQSAAVNAWIDAQGFAAGAGSLLLLPGEDGLVGALIGIGDALDPSRFLHRGTVVPVALGEDQIPHLGRETGDVNAPIFHAYLPIKATSDQRDRGCGLGRLPPRPHRFTARCQPIPNRPLDRGKGNQRATAPPE